MTRADQCQTCGQDLQEGDAVREIRRVTKIWATEGRLPASVSTDRLYPTVAGWEHRVCPPPAERTVDSEERTVTPQPARVVSDLRLTTPLETMYYIDPATSRQIPIIDQSIETEMSYMVRGPLGTRETRGIGWGDEQVVGEKRTTRTTYVVLGAYPELGQVGPMASDVQARTTIVVVDEGIWRYYPEPQERS